MTGLLRDNIPVMLQDSANRNLFVSPYEVRKKAEYTFFLGRGNKMSKLTRGDEMGVLFLKKISDL